MQKSQKGFTLIELVVVIVLLGILGVTAMARYQDLSAQAANAAISAVAAELSSAAAINYAASVVGVAGFTVLDVSDNLDCDTANDSANIAPLFASGAIPTDYTFVDTGTPGSAVGEVFKCIVDNPTGPGTTTAIATLIYTTL